MRDKGSRVRRAPDGASHGHLCSRPLRSRCKSFIGFAPGLSKETHIADEQVRTVLQIVRADSKTSEEAAPRSAKRTLENILSRFSGKGVSGIELDTPEVRCGS